ncbi:hypothetical protein [Botryobacter ruber]|uniref:hypothetical protein n=1 Tax=Botryobacter ruber TaxID=2171629 RepID=UPI000F649B60|nr:hypothetical protein [Botryobacter ruber]
MKPIVINRTIKDYYRQALFIEKVTRHSERKRLRNTFFTLVTLSVLLVGIITIGTAETFIGFTIVLVFAWVIFSIYSLIRFIRFQKLKNLILRKATEEVVKGKRHEISFNEEFIKYFTDDAKVEFKWNNFKAYLEEEDTIYLIPENPKHTWSFSKEEIGAKPLSDLCELAKSKLPQLKY